LEIRALYTAGDITRLALANRFGVSLSCIKHIIYRKTWREV
jgi:hypothetical protein